MYRFSYLIFFLCLGPNTQAQFSGAIQHLTAGSSAKMHGISLPDLDSDGDLDILATFTSGVVSFENDGLGKFSEEKNWFDFDLPTPINPLPARFADLDGDGMPDLAANNSWRKNLSDGQFAAPAAVFANPLAALCDVDSDGRLDAIHYNSSTLLWQKNNQNGSFLFPTSIGSGANWQFWAVADLNSDGFSDLVLSRNFRFYWYKNNQNNTFTGIQIDASAPKHAIAADVDNDGHTDLLVGFSTEIRWLRFDSLGQWTLQQTIPTPTFQGGLALGDSDGDGDQDLIVGDFNDDSNLRLRWFRMLPDGLFSTTATGGIGAYPDGYNRNLVALGDLDGNGEIDLVCGSRTIETTVRMALDGATPGSFPASWPITSPISNIYQVLPADLDLDGDHDLVAANFLLEKTGNGQFAPRRTVNLPDKKVQFADLNGDTLPDAIYPFGNTVAWQRNLGNFKFDTRTLLDDLIFLNKDVGAADLDADGDFDLFAANGTEAPGTSGTARWYENDGSGNFSDHLLASGINYCSDVYAVDLNDDGRPDPVLLLGAPDADLWFENLGGGIFSAAKTVWTAGVTEPDGGLNQKSLADLDDDGRLDLVCCTRDYGIVSVYWYKNLGTGTFSDRNTLLNISQNASAGGLRFTIFDATNDGIPDIVVSGDYHRHIHFLKGLGNGDFAPAETIVDDDGFSGFNAIVHYDVDDDGRLDLVFGNADASNGGKNALSWLGGMLLSSANTFFEKRNFRIFPNPVSGGKPLRIFLENSFFGAIKIEMISLNGQILHTFDSVKNAEQFIGILNTNDVSAPFFVRISNGMTVATQLVLKF